jgi:DNA-directed RNA polymerase specialized sigma24 family protein
VSKPKPKRPPMPPLRYSQELAPTHTAVALNLVTEMDLLRLKSIARLYARGLPPDTSWDDLLQEAITRVLTGKRVKPEDVAMVGFLGGVMRSLRADHVRRARRGVADPARLGSPHESEQEVLDPTSDPERAVIATEELHKIRRLFADDALAVQIIDGLAEGLDAEQIRARHGISKTEYDSARKRMRRALLREGLTCAPK